MLLYVDKLSLETQNLLPNLLPRETTGNDDDLDGAESDGFSAARTYLYHLLRKKVQRTTQLFLDAYCNVVLNGSKRTNFQIDRRLLVFRGLKIENVALLDAWKTIRIEKERCVGKCGRMEIDDLFTKRTNNWNTGGCC